MPGGIGLANPQFPYKSYFDPIGEAAPSSYTYDVTTKNQFALRSFKDDDGNCFTDMVLMSDGADSTSTFRLFTNTPEGNAVERMAVTNTGVITGTSATYTGQVRAATVLATTSLTSASLTVSENASVSNVTQTTPVLFKISLQSANDLNDSTTYTIRNLFGSGSIQKFNNGVFTYTDNTITVPSNGYYRVTMNFKWNGNNDNLSIGVQPVISGADSGEIFSGFEGNRASFANPCISSSSIYNLTGNRQIGFKFAKLGSNGTATLEGSASFVLIEKL
jgi:hypothetical protein